MQRASGLRRTLKKLGSSQAGLSRFDELSGCVCGVLANTKLQEVCELICLINMLAPTASSDQRCGMLDALLRVRNYFNPNTRSCKSAPTAILLTPNHWTMGCAGFASCVSGFSPVTGSSAATLGTGAPAPASRQESGPQPSAFSC